MARIGDEVITVRAGALPGRIKEYVLGENRTVADVAEIADLPTDGEWRVNQQPANLTDEVPNGATVVRLVPVQGA